MTNLTHIIEQLGLSDNEANVYLASLQLGETHMTTLAKKAHLKRPTTYLAVDRLEMLGLVSRTKKGKRNVISPVHPRRLVQIAQLRHKQIEESLPQLLGLYNDNNKKPKVQMLEGLEAVERVYQEAFESMRNKKEFMFFTNIASITGTFLTVAEIFPRLLYKHPTIKVRELVYNNEGGRDWVSENKLSKNKGWEARLSEKDSHPFGDNEIMITENTVAYLSAGSDIFVIFIESEDLAKTQKAMFEMAWTKAGKI